MINKINGLELKFEFLILKYELKNELVTFYGIQN
jgi:hypothetical protein